MDETRLIFKYNRTTCIGCASCQMACKDEHGLMPGEFFRRVTLQTVKTKGGDVKVPVSLSCNHCDKPACVDACPTGAMHTAEGGLVLHDDGLCIGCGRCYWACPYGEVSMSMVRGTAQKCDTCLERRSKGLEPACVAACPTASIRFGPADELPGEKLEAAFLPPYEETEPSTKLDRPFPEEAGDE